MNPASLSSAPAGRRLAAAAGILVSASPLAVWACWRQMPSMALLAPLLLLGLIAGTALALKKHVRRTLEPILPSVRLTLAASAIFTAVCLFSQAAFSCLPLMLTGMGIMPCAWIIPLGHVHLAIQMTALLILSMTAACACLLCTGRWNKRAVRQQVPES